MRHSTASDVSTNPELPAVSTVPGTTNNRFGTFNFAAPLNTSHRICTASYSLCMIAKSPHPPARSSSLDNFLGASEVFLTVVKDVSSVTAVPFMRDAAELSLTFLNIVQTVRENKEAWICLAENVAQLVSAVAAKVNNAGSHTLDSDTVHQVRELYRMLLKVREIVDAMKSRNLFKRIVGSRDDATKLQQYRDDLRAAIDLFGVRAAITNAENMRKVTTSQDTLVTGQQSLATKQDEVLSRQRVTNEFLQKINTSINTLKTTSSAPSPSSTVPVSPYAMSPVSFCPESVGYPRTIPSNSNITVIHGDHVINNVQTVNTNVRSNQETTINTINSHNTSVLPTTSPIARRNIKVKQPSRRHTVPRPGASR